MKRHMMYSLVIFGFLGISFTAAGDVSAKSYCEKQEQSSRPKVTIVDIVTKNDGEFDVLQAAVIRAGLVDTLNGNRQYTVFAPTDAAFVKTLSVANEQAAIDAVQGLDLKTLENILLYHVTVGRKSSDVVMSRDSLRMLNRQELPKEKLTQAGIATTDTKAKNGIVHVINSVLMP